MSETYCGKLCTECTQKETLACPGCNAGPGGTCTIAKCCRQKGHENCSTCSFRASCNLQLQKEIMPRQRQALLQVKAAKAASLTKRATFYSKWLWPLFWLVIPSTIAGIMTNDTIIKYFPALFFPGAILQTASTLAYGAILLKLSQEEDMYRIPGILRLGCGALVGIFDLLLGMPLSSVIVLALPAAIANLVSEYMEITAHSGILADLDGALSEKWSALWKWRIRLYGGLLGCVLLVLISRVLGLLALIAVLIGLAVIGVLKLVYLYQTANVFSNHLRDSESGLE